MKKILEKRKSEEARQIKVKVGKSRMIITSPDQLEALYNNKKRPKKVYLTGDTVSLSMTSQSEGVFVQPSRTVDGNLLTKSKALMYVGLPQRVMEIIKKGKMEKRTFLLVDNIIRWSLQRFKKERTFNLYCVFLHEKSHLVERYRFVDRKLHSIEQRVFPGSLDMQLVMSLLGDDLHHPAYLASQDDISGAGLPVGVTHIGDAPFRTETHREIDFGKGKSYIKEYALPFSIVACAIFSFYAVDFWQKQQLDKLQQKFQKTISGMEDSYYSGGRDINLLERQQYFLEEGNEPRGVHDQLTQVIGIISSLRKDDDYSFLTLDTVHLPHADQDWDIEFTLKVPESNAVSRSLQSSRLVRAIADKTGWEVITLQPPSATEHNGMNMLLFYVGAKQGEAS